MSQETVISRASLGYRGLDTPQPPPKYEVRSVSAIRKFNTPTPIQPVSDRFPALEKQETIFSFFAPTARQVNIAGNFNGWRPDATPLKRMGAGDWFVRMALRSGQYEYRFVVDGRWTEDPQAAARVANSFGQFNSVLVLPLAVKTSIL